MINVKYILRPFAGFLSTFAICMAASAQECSDLAVVHDLLPSIDNQISGKNTLAYNDGPLEPGKTGYGFGLRETLFDGLTCKANPLFRDRKIVLNCAVSTPSKARADEISNEVLGCLLENGWGQRGIYLVDPENDVTLAKLYSLKDSFSIEFVQLKPASRSDASAAP